MRALRTALRTTALRRLLLSYVGVSLGTWAFAILFSLYAYAEGGTTAVGLAVLVRMLPAGLAASSLPLLADRHSRRAVLVIGAGPPPASGRMLARALVNARYRATGRLAGEPADLITRRTLDAGRREWPGQDV
jgi:MFS family permease